MQRPDDPWLSFYEAVNEIKRELGVSRGKAEAMLRHVCSTGEIRSQKQPYAMINREPDPQGPPERIERHEWRDHDIDQMTDSNGYNYFVDVEKSDFEYWLNNKRKKPAGGKQAPVHALLAKMFSNSPVPDGYQRKTLRRELLKLDPTLKPLDEATLKKHIDSYNADPKRNRLHSD